MAAYVEPRVCSDPAQGAANDAVPLSEPLPDMRRRVAVQIPGATGLRQLERTLPEEVPVAFRVDDSDYAVMLASPGDIEDFAVGFMLSEGVIGARADMAELRVAPKPEGLVVHIALRDPFGLAPGKHDRRVAGVTGCGLCGVETLRETIKPLPWLADGPRIAPEALRRALNDLRAWQPHNALSGALHAAAFADAEGNIQLAREDVGRHNALDKLIGALTHRQQDPSRGFVVMSSRCSFELVQKVARCGIRLLCTVSSPTALAVRLAHRANLTLLTRGKDGNLLLLSGAHRITN